MISPHSDPWMSKSRVGKVVSHYRQSAVPVCGIAPDCGVLPVPGAIELVSTLRSTGCGWAVLTDVPYAMPRRLILEDLAAAGLDTPLDGARCRLWG